VQRARNRYLIKTDHNNKSRKRYPSDVARSRPLQGSTVRMLSTGVQRARFLPAMHARSPLSLMGWRQADATTECPFLSKLQPTVSAYRCIAGECPDRSDRSDSCQPRFSVCLFEFSRPYCDLIAVPWVEVRTEAEKNIRPPIFCRLDRLVRAPKTGHRWATLTGHGPV
jgi:hypothetical protein